MNILFDPPNRERISFARPLQNRFESFNVPLGAIIGIAVGGAVILAVVLGTLAFVCARSRHGQAETIPDANGDDVNDGLNIKDALKTIRPPATNYGQKVSAAPNARDEQPRAQGWVTDDPFRYPPATKVRRHSSHKSFLRNSSIGMRESWPLVTNIPLAMMSSGHTITLSEVAPPGYIIHSKVPRRAGSLWIKKNRSMSQGSGADSSSPTKSVKSVNSAVSAKSAPILSRSPKFDPPISPASRRPQKLPHRPRQHRRATSETQLSTILRSTTQRLEKKKVVHRNSLRRTMSALGRHPGKPPSEKPPDPPIWAAAGSREALIDKEYSAYTQNSLHSSFRNRTPSPVLKDQKDFQQTSGSKPSPTSVDSLCDFDTPDLVIPASLTSPSKRGSPLSAKRHRMQISSGDVQELSTMLHRKDSQPSSKVVGAENRQGTSLTVPKPTLSIGDPFYSSVRKSNRVLFPAQAPRPLFIRKATFGGEVERERPASFPSPLQEVSHNVRTPPKEKEQSTQDLTRNSAISQDSNPFKWAPPETLQTRSSSASPKKRKGHKRSNVVRLSGLSRPPSTVEVVLEEPEEDTNLKQKRSSLKFVLPEEHVTRVIEPEKSPSRKSSQRSSGFSPPTSTIFNPTISIPRLRAHSTSSSPIIVHEENRSNLALSPTLSPPNYFESSAGSKDEFLARSKEKALRNERTYSADLQNFPTYELQRELQERLRVGQDQPISFPLPLIATISPSTRSLPSVKSTLTSPPKSSLRSSAASPILTAPVPSHLTGPRAEPTKPARSPRVSTASNVNNSITMLRRMNSEISTYSSGSSAMISPNSSISAPFSGSGLRDAKRIRGSKTYSPLGDKYSTSSQLLQTKRISSKTTWDPHRISKDRSRKRGHGDFERLEDKSEDDEDEILNSLKVMLGRDMLTPVKESPSPAASKAQNVGLGLTLKFPTLNREGSTKTSPKASPPHQGSIGTSSLDRDDSPTIPTPTRARPKRSTLKPPTPNVEDSEEEEEGEQKEKGMGVKVIEESPPVEIPPKNPKRLSLPNPNLRFSSYTPTPASSVIRRESQMKYPSPQTPISGMGIAGLRLLGKGKGLGIEKPGEGNGEEKSGSGDATASVTSSPGFYDEEGFLRGSPDRERLLQGREEKRKKDRAIVESYAGAV